MTMIAMLMAAGAGSRFKDGSVPKPFRTVVDNIPMYEYVATKMGLAPRLYFEHTVLVTQSAFKDYAPVWRGKANSLVSNTIFVPNLVAAGPAWTAVAASLNYADHSGLMLFDTDCFVEPLFGKNAVLWQMLGMPTPLGADAVVFAVRATEDTDSAATVHVEVEDDGGNSVTITEGGVKAGDLLNVGVYFFRNIKAFRSSVFQAQQAKGSVGDSSELKLSEVLSRIRHVECCELEGTFVNLGTPELLQKHQASIGALQ